MTPPGSHGRDSVRVAVLAGGTGAARLARGLAGILPPGRLSVITNTADDEEMWGLLVCPDTDAVLYRLAGLFNEDMGFGVRDETFRALEMLGRLGEPTWFGLGDPRSRPPPAARRAPP